MNGVLLIDKPAGVTSHDVVEQTRPRFGRGVKVGHAGTLDPFATGLLLLLIGRATRVQRTRRLASCSLCLGYAPIRRYCCNSCSTPACSRVHLPTSSIRKSIFSTS